MNSRQRVELSLNHQEPDSVPVDLGGIFSSISKEAYCRLKTHLGLSGEDETISDFFTVTRCDERILEQFNVDFRRVGLRGAKDFVPKRFSDGSYTNEWGIRIKQFGRYAEMISQPLRGASLNDIDRYTWPSPHVDGRTDGLREEARELYEQTEYALIAEAPTDGLLGWGNFLVGFDQFPVDLLTRKDFAAKFIEKIAEISMGLYDVLLGAVGDYVQIVETIDDFGTQNGPIISPELYREMIKPAHKKLVEFIKSRTKAKVLIHSCGSVYALIPDLIDVGIDILNPLQPLAKDMDSERLKNRFGRRLCFHGGIDIQYVLPRGSVEDVRTEVKKRIGAFAPGGGYIFAGAHNIQDDTPAENVIFMFDAAHSYGKYPISKGG
jgi:uroporphyrinogen decarboxylase